jgi:hypothetical protein
MAKTIRGLIFICSILILTLLPISIQTVKAENVSPVSLFRVETVSYDERTVTVRVYQECYATDATIVSYEYAFVSPVAAMEIVTTTSSDPVEHTFPRTTIDKNPWILLLVTDSNGLYGTSGQMLALPFLEPTSEPTTEPPHNVVAEVPFGTASALIGMVIAIACYAGLHQHTCNSKFIRVTNRQISNSRNKE